MNIWKKNHQVKSIYLFFFVIDGFLKWFDKEDIYNYDYLQSKKYTNVDTPPSN